MRAPEGIERSHRKLYQSIQSELALFEKRKPKELLAYERAFSSAMPKTARAAPKADLGKSIARANVILIGDFHPFRQSQKGYLRLVEAHLPQFPRVVLALECVQQAHQLALNEYLSGYITVEELRDKIEFERFWPFSWENYREILQFAKRLSLPVLALNILERKRNPEMLKERDQAAAEKIAQEIFTHPESTVFVLYGELHLARPHLPKALRGRLGQKARLLVVHQNDPKLYWQTRRQANGQKPEILRLASDEFCLLNSVPWVKLRSYLDWLEGNPNSDDLDEGLDVAGTVHHYAKLLAEAIGLQVSIRDDVEIFPPERISTLSIPKFLKQLSAVDRILARHSLSFQRTGYLPMSGALLLPNITTNSLSEAASFLLRHSQRANGNVPGKPPPAWWIMHFLSGYLGSKVLNPKRKCNEVQDLREMLKHKAKRKGERSHTAVILRAFTLLQPFLKKEAMARRAAALTGAKEAEACRLAGCILGDRFFSSLLREPGLLAFVRSWYSCESPQGCKVVLAETGASLSRSAIKPLQKSERF